MVQQLPPPQPVYLSVPAAPRPAPNGFGVASLVTGIFAFSSGFWTFVPYLGILAGIVAFVPMVLAVIFGHIGLRVADRTGAPRGLAIAGLALGYSTVGIMFLVISIWIGSAFAAGFARTM